MPLDEGQVLNKPRGRKPRRTWRCRFTLWRLHACGGAVMLPLIGALTLGEEMNAGHGAQGRLRQDRAQAWTWGWSAPNTSWPCQRGKRRRTWVVL